jgi:hypothetical protein
MILNWQRLDYTPGRDGNESAPDEKKPGIRAAKKLRRFLNRAAGRDLGFEVVDIHLGPFGAVVNVHHKSSRRPLNTGCLTLPSADLERYSIYASKIGSTHVAR